VRPDHSELPPWSPGAHIDLALSPDLIRQYSLCGDPEDLHSWRVAVLAEQESSGGSRYVHEVLSVGMRVEAFGPRNTFRLVDAASYLLIAGGIGITPLLPMVRDLERRGREWHLVYGGRTRRSMAFLDELAEFDDRVDLVQEDRAGLIDVAGVVTTAPTGAAIYCCGPEALITAVETECGRQGRDAPHVERFALAPENRGTAHQVGDQAFELVLGRSGRRVTVRADQTIVEALRGVGIRVMTSCTEGQCGICETKVLNGLPDHRGLALPPSVRAANSSMLVCVSRSLTPELTIDL
jgi:ferredoxin-NADP reductase